MLTPAPFARNWGAHPYGRLNGPAMPVQAQSQAPMDSEMANLVRYVYQNNPTQVEAFLQTAGYKDKLSTNDPVEASIEMISLMEADKGNGIEKFLEYHPDKELILEVFAPKHNGPCQCKDCKKKRRRKIIGFILLVILIALITYFIVRWVRNRRAASAMAPMPAMPAPAPAPIVPPPNPVAQ